MVKLCKFHKNPTKNVIFNVLIRNANFQLKMATFPILMVRFFFLLINRVEAIYEIDKLCKVHENLTKNEDFIT